MDPISLLTSSCIHLKQPQTSLSQCTIRTPEPPCLSYVSLNLTVSGNKNHSKKERQILRKNMYQGPKVALVLCYGNAGIFYPLAYQGQAKDIVRDGKLGAERSLGLILQLFILGDARHHWRGCMD